MEEEIKAIRTMKEFIFWYDENKDNAIPASIALKLNEFYRKFSYILKQDEEETNRLAKFLG